jgi:hypothetical protein
LQSFGIFLKEKVQNILHGYSIKINKFVIDVFGQFILSKIFLKNKNFNNNGFFFCKAKFGMID